MAMASNTLIAMVVWLIGDFGGFPEVWLTSQCIGLAICYSLTLFDHLLGDRWGLFLLVGIAVPVGVLVGVVMADLFGASGAMDAVFGHWQGALRYLGMGVVFTVAVVWFFQSREHIHELVQARQAAELREMTGQKAALTARLRLLQAQIEPHFLFNTLANLHSLIGRDDAAARSLLERLNDYLRASLAHSRADQCSLGDEVRLLEAYLDIQARRMGGRLTWEIEVPEALRRRAFPPMLLQPLVENAIKHGLEPKVGPGRLRLAAREDNGALIVGVTDDGLGLGGKPHASGTGLANIRERLTALFGPEARLDLTENTPSGLTAQLWIPNDAPAR